MFRRQIVVCALPLLLLYVMQQDWRAYLIGVSVVLIPHLIFMFFAQKIQQRSEHSSKKSQTATQIMARLFTLYFARVLLISLGLIGILFYAVNSINPTYFILGVIVAAISYVIAGFKQYYVVGK